MVGWVVSWSKKGYLGWWLGVCLDLWWLGEWLSGC